MIVTLSESEESQILCCALSEIRITILVFCDFEIDEKKRIAIKKPNPLLSPLSAGP